MDWTLLLKYLPVLAGVANPAAGVALGVLLKIAEAEIARRQAEEPSKTVDEILLEAQAEWELGLARAEELRRMGHEEG